MGKPGLLKSEVKRIIKLRKTGHTLNEIKKIVGRGYGTIFRYIKDVPILPKYIDLWKIKKNGSRAKSKREWYDANIKASEIVGSFGYKERLLVLSSLYWGEGNKKELSLINSDPDLIRVFVTCLNDIGVSKDEIKISLRLFSDINRRNSVKFWFKVLGLPQNTPISFEIIKGKKVGKLKYGMCRIRVRKGRKYFKLVMSMIDLVRSGIK